MFKDTTRLRSSSKRMNQSSFPARTDINHEKVQIGGEAELFDGLAAGSNPIFSQKAVQARDSAGTSSLRRTSQMAAYHSAQIPLRGLWAKEEQRFSMGHKISLLVGHLRGKAGGVVRRGGPSSSSSSSSAF